MNLQLTFIPNTCLFNDLEMSSFIYMADYLTNIDSLHQRMLEDIESHIYTVNYTMSTELKPLYIRSTTGFFLVNNISLLYVDR